MINRGIPGENIREEVASTANKLENRPILYHLIENELKEGHVLMVTRLDRCSRNTLEFLKLQERLHNKGVLFISLDLPFSEDMAVNRLIGTILAAVANFENERRRERQREGIEAAKKAGRYAGRRTVITKKLIDQVQDLRENKHLTIAQIAKVTGKGRSTIYKVLKEELHYVPFNRLVKQPKDEYRINAENES